MQGECVYISVRTCLSAAPQRQVIISLLSLSLLRGSGGTKEGKIFLFFLRLDRGLLYQHSSSSFFLLFSLSFFLRNAQRRNERYWQKQENGMTEHLSRHSSTCRTSSIEDDDEEEQEITSLYVRWRRNLLFNRIVCLLERLQWTRRRRGFFPSRLTIIVTIISFK